MTTAKNAYFNACFLFFVQTWFTAVEMGHACQYLLRGSVRYIEAIYLPESAIIYESGAWMQLKSQLKATEPLSMYISIRK